MSISRLGGFISNVFNSNNKVSQAPKKYTDDIVKSDKKANVVMQRLLKGTMETKYVVTEGGGASGEHLTSVRAGEKENIEHSLEHSIQLLDKKINSKANSIFAFLNKNDIQKLKDRKNQLEIMQSEVQSSKNLMKIMIHEKPSNESAENLVRKMIDAKFPLTNLNQGLEKAITLYLKNAKNPEEIHVLQNLYSKLTDAQKEEFHKALANADTADQDRIVKLMVNNMDSKTFREISLGVLKIEVKISERSTLLRGNSMASKMMTALVRNQMFKPGNPYVSTLDSIYASHKTATVTTDTLQVPFNELDAEEKEQVNANPERETEFFDKQTRENMKNDRQQVTDNTKNVFRTLNRSVAENSNYFPDDVRQMFIDMKAALKEKFGDEAYAEKMVLNILYLRFISPTLIVEPPELKWEGRSEGQKQRVLTSKVIQTVVNAQEFKESHLAFSNNLIHDPEISQINKNILAALLRPVDTPGI